MKYKRLLITLLSMILLYTGFKVYNFYSLNSIHARIDISNVNSIRICGTSIKGDKYASSDETKDIINWFNSITDIRVNRNGVGVGTPDSSIIIQLKSGLSLRQVIILKSGLDFEVQRYDTNGKMISYWGRQEYIKKVLQEASGE